jgi:hypothetical protein
MRVCVVLVYEQGKLLKLLAKKVEFCYAPPSMSPLYVSKTASYSTGMQPGSASWNFFKTAQLAAPYTNNIASLFRGDTAVSHTTHTRSLLDLVSMRALTHFAFVGHVHVMMAAVLTALCMQCPWSLITNSKPQFPCPTGSAP